MNPSDFWCSGNPHPTDNRKGPNDPFHGSGAIGKKNLKKDDRETSLHIYPDGLVKPTNDKWPVLYVTAPSPEELGEDAVWLDKKYCEDYVMGQVETGGTSGGKGKSKKNDGKGKGKAAGGGGNDWEWDNEIQMNKRWDRSLGGYVCWDEAEQAERYWDGKEWKWLE